MTAILELRGLTKHFGGVKAVQGVDMKVDEGSITALIGPNGAGKTTCFNMITGHYIPTAGDLIYRGLGSEKSLIDCGADNIAKQRIARTFQNIRLCPEQTVLDNVRIGFHTQRTSRPWDVLLNTKRYRQEEAAMTASARAVLEFVGMKSTEENGLEALLSDSLPYGDKRRLEIARALASNPALLLLDEPAAGMNPQETEVLMDLIRKTRAAGVTILLIEHDMKLVMEISDHVVVLDHGEKIAEGAPAEVQKDPAVIAAYLGQEEGERASQRLKALSESEAETVAPGIGEAEEPQAAEAEEPQADEAEAPQADEAEEPKAEEPKADEAEEPKNEEGSS